VLGHVKFGVVLERARCRRVAEGEGVGDQYGPLLIAQSKRSIGYYYPMDSG
jgi:hypothetical protein